VTTTSDYQRQVRPHAAVSLLAVVACLCALAALVEPAARAYLQPAAGPPLAPRAGPASASGGRPKARAQCAVPLPPWESRDTRGKGGSGRKRAGDVPKVCKADSRKGEDRRKGDKKRRVEDKRRPKGGGGPEAAEGGGAKKKEACKAPSLARALKLPKRGTCANPSWQGDLLPAKEEDEEEEEDDDDELDQLIDDEYDTPRLGLADDVLDVRPSLVGSR
jgi:hypothetical protein